MLNYALMTDKDELKNFLNSDRIDYKGSLDMCTPN